MKRMISLLLTVSIFSSLVVPSFALENVSTSFTDEISVQLLEENLCLAENEKVIATTPLNNGKIGIVSCLDNSDGSSTYTYFENDIPLRIYNVTPGSGYYTVTEYNNTLADRMSMAHSGQKVFVGEPANANSASPTNTQSDSDYEYWGTVNYYYALTDKHFSITCLINENRNEYAQFSPVAYYADIGAFIASIIALFLAPEKAAMEEVAETIWDNAIARGLLVKVAGTAGGFILTDTFAMDAYKTTYDIYAYDASGESSGEFHASGGYDVYVYVDQGLFSGTTYRREWTKDDWGNPVLGIQMAWEVFGMEYNPSSWS